MDGLSVSLLGLSALLVPLCLQFISWDTMDSFNKEFMISLLLMLLMLVGVFTSLNVLVFYMLLSANLMLMFLLMGVGGSSLEKLKAAFFSILYIKMISSHVN